MAISITTMTKRVFREFGPEEIVDYKEIDFSYLEQRRHT
ncbi:hypothetical protein SP41_129 [Salmonella phage 41]|nr:hypothetical protein SP41_129 [Salmonella phage 41]